MKISKSIRSWPTAPTVTSIMDVHVVSVFGPAVKHSSVVTTVPETWPAGKTGCEHSPEVVSGRAAVPDTTRTSYAFSSFTLQS